MAFGNWMNRADVRGSRMKPTVGPPIDSTKMVCGP